MRLYSFIHFLIMDPFLTKMTIALNTVGSTVGTSHTTVSTPRGTNVFPCNTTCIWTTENDGDMCTPIPGMSNFTQIVGNPDSSSRTVTGQRTTITSDHISHLSETKPTEHGTRRLTLDHTP